MEFWDVNGYWMCAGFACYFVFPGEREDEVHKELPLSLRKIGEIHITRDLVYPVFQEEQDGEYTLCVKTEGKDGKTWKVFQDLPLGEILFKNTKLSHGGGRGYTFAIIKKIARR